MDKKRPPSRHRCRNNMVRPTVITRSLFSDACVPYTWVYNVLWIHELDAIGAQPPTAGRQNDRIVRNIMSVPPIRPSVGPSVHF